MVVHQQQIVLLQKFKTSVNLYLSKDQSNETSKVIYESCTVVDIQSYIEHQTIYYSRDYALSYCIKERKGPGIP